MSITPVMARRTRKPPSRHRQQTPRNATAKGSKLKSSTSSGGSSIKARRVVGILVNVAASARIKHWMLIQAESGTQRELEVPETALVLDGDEIEAMEEAGRLVFSRILKRRNQPLIGRLVTGERTAYVISESPEFRGRIAIAPGNRHKAKDSDRVAVRVVGEDQRGLIGRVIEVVASAKASDRASIGLLRAYGVPTQWSENVLEATRKLPGRIHPGRYKERSDLSGIPLVTIDGKDARDFDDAVYCRVNRNGGWRLTVAIADVSQYVKPGGELDNEARVRGNSVYLPDRMIPMLPEELSTGLCSLRPKEHRLALVCEMTISAGGEVLRSRFREAVIYSWARLTYSQVALFLDGKALEHDPEIHKSLHALHSCYKALRGARESRGALDFRATEVEIQLDESGNVEAVVPVERNDAHRMIEESMIAANVCAARFIERNKRHCLYRVHGGPSGEKLEALRASLLANGLWLPEEEPTPKDLQNILENIGDRPDRELIETLVLRSMTQASYSPHNSGHFGLALDRYMHFTSPIRRYADLLVHRTIRRILRGTHGDSVSLPELDDIGHHISSTERRAEDVSRDVADWYKCAYASHWVGHRFIARVMGVTDFGLFMELENLRVQALMHISNLGGDYFEFNPEKMCLVGRRSGRKFVLGDELEVVLTRVDVDARKMDVEPVEAERRRRGKSRGKKGRKTGQTGAKRVTRLRRT